MKLKPTLALLGIFFSFPQMWGQEFTKIEPAGIANVMMAGNFRGVAWVDVDYDGDLDLSIGGSGGFFFNDGNDEFSFQASGLFPGSLGGVSWGDVDQDGDVDCLYDRGGVDSPIYLNDGSGNFSEYDLAPMASPHGWDASLGDWNNDGWLDAAWAVPVGFGPFTTPALFYQNNGNLMFEEIDTFQFTLETAAYTIAHWIDFDDDGDQDLFFASGPVNVAKEDPIYRNMLMENGTPGFERVTDLPFATQLQDGQCYNFVDTDLDGDRDLFLTNFLAAPNRYYELDNGTYVERSVPMVGPAGAHLGNCWGDLDNDGYEDVIITGNSPNTIRGLWRNLGGHQYEKIDLPEYDTSTHIISGLTIGDYDGDGDLDFFGIGDKPPVTVLTLTSFRGLFRNDLSNGNHWVQFDLTGLAPSNTSALGARVRVKASINGQQRWLQREVSASNTFKGHNALRVHFGLGQTTSIDSVVINWPSGRVNVLTDMAVDMLHAVTETEPPSSVFGSEPALPALLISPNPAKGHCTVQVPDGWEGQPGVLKIYDAQGKVLMSARPGLPQFDVDTHLYPPGLVFVSWTIGEKTYSGKFLVN